MRAVLRALLLACLTVGAGYSLLFMLYQIVPVNFGYWFFAVMPIPTFRLGYYPLYFLIFLVSAAVMTCVNVTFAYSDGRETKAGIAKQYLVPLAVAIGGVAAVMAVFYITLRANGHTTLLPFKSLDSVTLGSTYPVIPNYMVASLVSTAVYRKTKNTYLVMFLTALLLAALTICTNSFSI